MMWYGDAGGWGWGMMIIRSLVWLVFLGAIVFAIWSAARPSGRTESATGITPLDILKARYARGEINRDEFEQNRRDLA